MSTFQIFLGGGVTLLHGENGFLQGYRNNVVDPVVSQLNSREHVKYVYIVKDYTDLTRNVVQKRHQEVYNQFIERKSQIALFIIDGEIGNITKHEIDIAVAATKRTHHPIVFIYGKNINEGNELLGYLNQEGIYYQHFFDNKDLASKINADLEYATRTIARKRMLRMAVSLSFSLLLCCGIISLINIHSQSKEAVNCTAQLYLMRYQDVNVLTGKELFNDSILSLFKYEDSLITGTNDVSVFPIIKAGAPVTATAPIFRLKLYNKNRNTIVFVEAKIEIENYIATSTAKENTTMPLEELPKVDVINVDENKKEYLLKSFRQNVAYGETDDRYFFTITSDKDCKFRMRVRLKSHNDDYLYSNYIFVDYKKAVR